MSIACMFGCSTLLPGDESHVDRLVISNLSNVDVEDVVLSVPSSGRIISINRILKGTDYSLRFPVTKTDNNPSFITWQWRGRVFTERLRASNEAVFFAKLENRAFTVKIELLDAGMYNVFLE